MQSVCKTNVPLSPWAVVETQLGGSQIPNRPGTVACGRDASGPAEGGVAEISGATEGQYDVGAYGDMTDTFQRQDYEMKTTYDGGCNAGWILPPSPWCLGAHIRTSSCRHGAKHRMRLCS